MSKRSQKRTDIEDAEIINIEPETEKVDTDEAQPIDIESINIDEDKINSFSRFKQNTIKRDYANYNVAKEQYEKLASQPVPEAHIEETNIDIDKLDETDIIDLENDNEPQQKQHKEPKEPKRRVVDEIRNPAVEDMTTKELNMKAKQTAQFALKTYRQGMTLSGNLFKISEDKFHRRIANGRYEAEILNVEIPRANGRSMTILDFISDYNAQIDEILGIGEDYDEEWEKWQKDIEPVLTRVLAKHGWVMTDEQYLITEIGKDILTRIGASITMQMTNNSILKSLNNTVVEQRSQMKKEASEASMLRQRLIDMENSDKYKQSEIDRLRKEAEKAKAENPSELTVANVNKED